MKTIKAEKEDSKINRKLITKFGEAVYSCDEVKGIAISVKFKDGSSISFRKEEEDDTVESMINKEEENN